MKGHKGFLFFIGLLASFDIVPDIISIEPKPSKLGLYSQAYIKSTRL